MDLRLTPAADPAAWDRAVAALPHGHILQAWAWGAFKGRHGWRPHRHLWLDEGGEPQAAAQVLERDLQLPGVTLRVLYCPKGPLLDWGNEALRARVLADLAGIAKERRAILLKVDPDLPVGYGVPGEPEAREDPLGLEAAAALRRHGWRPSPDQVQFRNTMVLDLTQPEEALLAAMKQKARYNVRLAARRGVQVRPGASEDLPLLADMYAETAARDGFVIRPKAYYLDLWGDFLSRGLAQPFLAEVEGEPVAGLVLFRFGETAWYFYGMSRDRHREKMPNHLLQWEAIRWAKAQGCRRYDLWGAPDRFDESDSMWGVYRFKRGFGAEVVQTLGAWDLPARPMLYALYTRLLPRVLALMRARARAAAGP